MSNLFAGFRDPARRPRFIIWSVIVVMVGIILWAFMLVGTCAPWFCETPCHIVHDDNTLAYNVSTHSKITCVACHEPVNANPIQFTILKIFVIPDLYSTVTKTFELPMNSNDETALSMKSTQCTQCHNMDNRIVSSSPGIIIDHKAHTSRGIQCTFCHNRVAHPEENVTFILNRDRKHENWMKMTACFRCHSQEPGSKIAGTCPTCHPKTFNLIPASHEATNWFNPGHQPFGHSAAARVAADVAAVGKALELHSEQGEVEKPLSEVEPKSDSSAAINLCFTCHQQTFCDACHSKLRPSGK